MYTGHIQKDYVRFLIMLEKNIDLIKKYNSFLDLQVVKQIDDMIKFAKDKILQDDRYRGDDYTLSFSVSEKRLSLIRYEFDLPKKVRAKRELPPEIICNIKEYCKEDMIKSIKDMAPNSHIAIKGSSRLI